MADAGTQPKHHYIVEILPGPAVNQEPVYPSKKGQDIITWHCHFDPNWKVDFGADSPFEDRVFDQNHDTAGPVRKEAVEGKYYKYTVTVGGKSIDPGVVIDP